MNRYKVEITYLNDNCGPFTGIYTVEASSPTEAENELIEEFENYSDHKILSCRVVSLLP
jgi:hypothetical protein